MEVGACRNSPSRVASHTHRDILKRQDSMTKHHSCRSQHISLAHSHTTWYSATERQCSNDGTPLSRLPSSARLHSQLVRGPNHSSLQSADAVCRRGAWSMLSLGTHPCTSLPSYVSSKIHCLPRQEALLVHLLFSCRNTILQRTNICCVRL